MSSKISSLAMSDEQLEAFAKAYKQVEERARRGEIRDKASIEAALQFELNKTLPIKEFKYRFAYEQNIAALKTARLE
jgi:hypothetical protein